MGPTIGPKFLVSSSGGRGAPPRPPPPPGTLPRPPPPRHGGLIAVLLQKIDLGSGASLISRPLWLGIPDVNCGVLHLAQKAATLLILHEEFVVYSILLQL